MAHDMRPTGGRASIRARCEALDLLREQRPRAFSDTRRDSLFAQFTVTISPSWDPARPSIWFEEQMKAKYELTVGGRLGPGPKDAKEISMLNRIVRWTPRGIE